MTRRYVGPLDGLRAIAVLCVLLFHWGFLGFGWVGVQIFFVLSGYLISNNLLEDRLLVNSFSGYLKRFYWRRVLRIFPLYFGYVFVFILISVLVNDPTIKKLWPFLLTYTLNIYAILPGHTSFSYIGHFWSLAVEEQFYLVWPLLIFFLPTRLFKRLAWIIVLFIPIARYFVFTGLINSGNDPMHAANVVDYVTLFQMDAFSVGALVALFRPGGSSLNNKKIKLFLGAGFVVLLATSGFNLLSILKFYSTDFPSKMNLVSTLGFPAGMIYNLQIVWGYSLINILTGILILCIVHYQNPLGMLDNAVLKYIGKISYGVYVFHIPVRNFLFALFPVKLVSVAGVFFCIVYILITLLVSSISYQYFEKWFLMFKERLPGSNVAQYDH